LYNYYLWKRHCLDIAKRRKAEKHLIHFNCISFWPSVGAAWASQMLFPLAVITKLDPQTFCSSPDLLLSNRGLFCQAGGRDAGHAIAQLVVFGATKFWV
jgi:hypothetical protein